MSSETLLHLYPTLAMLAEDLNRAGLSCRMAGEDDARFHCARRYRRAAPSEGTLYVFAPGEDARFPAAQAGSACGGPQGALLLCAGCAPEALLDRLIDLFEEYWQMEARLDGLVYRNASLQALCELGAALMENPICIHDDWFVMVGQSAELSEVMPPDYIMSSNKAFIPRIIIEDFKSDSEYLETYAHQTAQLWDASPGRPPCVYANLWEGSVYRGRLLAVRYHRDFILRDYMLAEVLAQRALTLLGRKRLGQDRPHRGMDDIVYDLLRGRQVEARETLQLASMLGWRREDSLVCIRVRNQQQGVDAVMEHALHSDLFRAFPQGYIMFAEGQQCALVNLTREESSLSMVRHRLAPLCRDYCLYAGLSLPVQGLGELAVAYRQAEIALQQAFRLRSEKWAIAFDDCAVEYLLQQAGSEMPLSRLVAPELTRLRAYDAEKGTQYFDTLRAFLLQERDIPRTAQALIIHRTTLLYRLKKMREIVPLELDDPRRRLYLALSLKILEDEG